MTKEEFAQIQSALAVLDQKMDSMNVSLTHLESEIPEIRKENHKQDIEIALIKPTVASVKKLQFTAITAIIGSATSILMKFILDK